MANVETNIEKDVLSTVEVEQAKENFARAFGEEENPLAEKLFTLKYQSLNEKLKNWRWFVSAISIAVGTLSAMVSFNYAKNLVLAVILGISVSIFVEGMKQILFHFGLPALVTIKKQPSVLLIVAAGGFILAGLSAYMTIDGANALHEIMKGNNIIEATQSFTAEKDSVINSYTEMIKTARQDAETFRRNNLVNDKKAGLVLSYKGNTRARYDSLTAKVSELESAKLSTANRYDAQKPSIKTEISKDMEASKWFFLAIAILIETAIFSIMYFEAVYKSKQKQEKKMLQKLMQKNPAAKEAIIRVITVYEANETNWIDAGLVTSNLPLSPVSNINNTPIKQVPQAIGFAYNNKGGGGATPPAPPTVAPTNPTPTPQPSTPTPSPAPIVPNAPASYSAGQQITFTHVPFLSGDPIVIEELLKGSWRKNQFLLNNSEIVEVLLSGGSISEAGEFAKKNNKPGSRSQVQNVKRTISTTFNVTFIHI